MRIKKRALITLAATLPFILLGLFYLHEGIIAKAKAYIFHAKEISELYKVFLLAGVAFFVSKDLLRLGLMLLTMMVAIFLLGGIRVNMIVITLFLYLMILEGRLKHPLVLVLLGYFSLKSLFFVRNIFIHNDGFKGWLLY